MSDTVLKSKKKKKPDFELLRKLEDEYDEAKEDAERKERHLIERVHAEYLKAENKGEFFENLHHSENWYKERFAKYDLPLQFASKSDAMKEVHQERKVQSIVEDLEEMEEEIPILEVDDTLKDGVDYVDPAEQRRDWIEQTKKEILSEEPKAITEDSNFGKYQATKQMLSKARDVSKFDFDVSENYKNILIHQLDKTITYLKSLREDLD